MKIQLKRASTVIKEIEFAAEMPALEIRRLSIDLMFENYDRNETHIWPREEDARGARQEIHVLSDDGSALKSFNIREMAQDAGLKFLGRAIIAAS